MSTFPRSSSAALLLAIVLTVSGCAVDRSAPPPRSSPEPEVVATLESTSWVLDEMRDEPTWYDRDNGYVYRLRDGVVERVQDRALTPWTTVLSPPVLRVFDDDSIALIAGVQLLLYPVGGEVVSEELVTLEVALDGRSIDDLWYAAWFADDALGYRLCHRVDGATDCSVALPNVGGYSAALVVADDGSVYVTDRDESVLRYADGELTTIGSIPGGVREFRRGAGRVLGIAGTGLYEIDAAGLRQIDARTVRDVVVTEEGDYVATTDTEMTKVDPACRDTWSQTCDRRLLWSQIVVEQVRDDGVVEIAHEDCDDAHREVCDRAFFGLGLDGERVVLIGTVLRGVTR